MPFALMRITRRTLILLATIATIASLTTPTLASTTTTQAAASHSVLPSSSTTTVTIANVIMDDSRATTATTATADDRSKSHHNIRIGNSTGTTGTSIGGGGGDGVAAQQQDQWLLPNVETWPHRPVYLKPGAHTQILGSNNKKENKNQQQQHNEPLPLGVPFEFETPLFKGKLLVRFRHTKTDDTSGGHEAYFAGRNRVMQTVVQGRFKKALRMDEVYVGSIFKEPMSLVPPPFFMRLLNALFHRVAPGAILDFASQTQPKVVTLYAGTAQTMSVHVPGLEPDMTDIDLPEHFPAPVATLPPAGRKQQQQQHHAKASSSSSSSSSLNMFRSIAERKRRLSKPEKAKLHTFDTDHVYTMQIYDENMDYGAYQIKLPVYGNFNLSDAIGPQPMSLSAVTTSGEVVYDFDVWHESVYRLKYHGSSSAAADSSM